MQMRPPNQPSAVRWMVGKPVDAQCNLTQPIPLFWPHFSCYVVHSRPRNAIVRRLRSVGYAIQVISKPQPTKVTHFVEEESVCSKVESTAVQSEAKFLSVGWK